MVLWGVLLWAAAVPCVGAGSLMREPLAFFSRTNKEFKLSQLKRTNSLVQYFLAYLCLGLSDEPIVYNEL